MPKNRSTHSIGMTVHDQSLDHLFEKLNSAHDGLSKDEAAQRKEVYGSNRLPEGKPVSLVRIFFNQFLSPLIYILLIAGGVSLFLNHYTDAAFIFGVLVLNAIIGTIQEYAAERSAQSLKKIITATVEVVRSHKTYQVDSIELVPGDVIFLSSGQKVPADLRLIDTNNVQIDESILTGESLAVVKDHTAKLHPSTPLSERTNCAYAGTIVNSGRAKGLVTATGTHTEIGKIAESLTSNAGTKTPLLIRMEKFSLKLSIFSGITILILATILLIQGDELTEILLTSVALAVAAIPEGLPVAITVALAIATQKMAKRNVIVRKLSAVESLGSCDYIATDKTGTLTINQLTVETFATVEATQKLDSTPGISESVALAALLSNEAMYVTSAPDEAIGDAVDVAIIQWLDKNSPAIFQEKAAFETLFTIPYEPQNKYSAKALRKHNSDHLFYCAKGAVETIADKCKFMVTASGNEEPIDVSKIVASADKLAEDGYRVIAICYKKMPFHCAQKMNDDIFGDMIYLGHFGLIDPLRPDAIEAIKHTKNSGVQVAMVTGDHPKTALAISQRLGLVSDKEQAITGPHFVNHLQDNSRKDLPWHVYARMEPQHKLELVKRLQNNGHFVAVTGDGVNDAPALKTAHVGVAMGKSGTDVAKEAADLIITDDKFSSIVAGIEEGRVAFNNIRKVSMLVLATGAAEIVLFILSVIFNMPLPLTAVQLLWLNLVTNGIQDVAFAFEPKEGDELKSKPRNTSEGILNRLMLERIGLTSLLMGSVAFFNFYWQLKSHNDVDMARNSTLLLMVLFENIMIGNCKSERKSIFKMNPFSNKFLLMSALAAQGIHILAMHSESFGPVLGAFPVSLDHWFVLLGMALTVLIPVEVHKRIKRERTAGTGTL